MPLVSGPVVRLVTVSSHSDDVAVQGYVTALHDRKSMLTIPLPSQSLEVQHQRLL